MTFSMPLMYGRGGRQPRPLREAEEIFICPYNKTHRVKADRLELHVRNCREMYRQEKAEKRIVVFKLSCKFNPRHKLFAPELGFHEHRCPDKHRIPYYMIDVQFQGQLAGKDGTLGSVSVKSDGDSYRQGPINSFAGEASFGKPSSVGVAKGDSQVGVLMMPAEFAIRARLPLTRMSRSLDDHHLRQPPIKMDKVVECSSV